MDAVIRRSRRNRDDQPDKKGATEAAPLLSDCLCDFAVTIACAAQF